MAWLATGWRPRSRAATCYGWSTCWSWWPSLAATSGPQPRRPGSWGPPSANGTSSATCGRPLLEMSWHPCWRTCKRPSGRALSGGPCPKAGRSALKKLSLTPDEGGASHRRARSGWESLTPSEQRVVSLVGQHLTNAEIAERLFISVPTVKSHLNRAFAKLGIENRGQLAAGAHCIEAPRAP